MPLISWGVRKTVREHPSNLFVPDTSFDASDGFFCREAVEFPPVFRHPHDWKIHFCRPTRLSEYESGGGDGGGENEFSALPNFNSSRWRI
jgi:hypothetical protein